jgi:hypothetical protein
MIENGLTKKINLNTNIFYAVINAVKTFKELFMWRHNVAPNSACIQAKQDINELLCAVQLHLCSKQGILTVFL